MIENQNPPKKAPGISWFWWILLAALIVWNLWTVLPRGAGVLDIPYSTFIDQVKSGNVTSVQIQGSEISGAFVKPISAPPESQTTSFLGASPNGTYQNFKTVFPEVIGIGPAPGGENQRDGV